MSMARYGITSTLLCDGCGHEIAVRSVKWEPTSGSGASAHCPICEEREKSATLSRENAELRSRLQEAEKVAQKYRDVIARLYWCEDLRDVDRIAGEALQEDSNAPRS